MRMLVRQNKHYDNLNDNIEDPDNDYGYFCELDIDDTHRDIEEPHQKNVTNYNKYYVYNYNYNDPKKQDDIIMNNHYAEDEIKEKYNNMYFLIQISLITTTGFILMYFTIKTDL